MASLNELREQAEDFERRIMALTNDAQPIRAQLANLDRQREKLRKALSNTKTKIEEFSAEPRISDHAVLRYLERKYGFDFETVRKEMLTDTVVAGMRMGAEGVKFNGGVLKIKGNTVTTYIA